MKIFFRVWLLLRQRLDADVVEPSGEGLRAFAARLQADVVLRHIPTEREVGERQLAVDDDLQFFPMQLDDQ